MTSWVPLHVHSQYSILHSTASIQALVAKGVEYECPSLALTDQGNMFGAVEFYKACVGASIHPILGCQLYMAPFSRTEKKKIHGHSYGYPLLLLVKNNQGYRNLCKLASLAHLEGFYYVPRIDRELLSAHFEGLICIVGGVGSEIGQAILGENSTNTSSYIEWIHQLFGDDLYFEMQRHKMHLIPNDIEPWLAQRYKDFFANQEKVEHGLLQMSRQYGISSIATNDIKYLTPVEWKAHEILMNIQSGEPCEIWEKDSMGQAKSKIPNPKREVLPSQEFYFKSGSQMRELFSDHIEWIEEGFNIAKKCEFTFDFKTKHYPVFVPPDLENKPFDETMRQKAAEAFLRKLCEEGKQKRYTAERLAVIEKTYPDKSPLNLVDERLAYELEIITSKGMCDYLLIVYDFIAWAKNQGIPMGPGRGSGAGSIILYLIGITDIEPLRFHLFFERFINPERISYPDIDVDICMERRQEVIEYTVQKYGQDKVAQIITFGTMKAKMVIKDVGRVLSIPLAKVSQIAKLIPEDINMTLEKALELDLELRQMQEVDPEVQRLIEIALTLEGSIRNTGVHAAGLIIGARPLMEAIPLCLAKDSHIAVTQYSMKPVESIGLLKIDFLGLKTLTSIQKAVQFVEQTEGKKIDWINLSLDDKVTFDLLNQGKTQGIFQLESSGMQELAKQLHIDKFEEIIAVGALYRPGPMEMIPSFINRKHGREPIEIDHEKMQSILAETYGIMVYQEQVMQIASTLARYSLGEGDVLRRAMGKKDKEEMGNQREKFKIGALENGISEEISMKIFDKIEKFASYGFNKSHAAAYGFLTYVTAYLKANHLSCWMGALMTSDRDDVTKLAKMIRECQIAGISVLAPSVNDSEKEFIPRGKGICFAMGGIKGVGEGIVDDILEERKKGGLFRSLYDFMRRVKIGKKVVEHLIDAGCFDFTLWPRAALVQAIEPISAGVARDQKEEAAGIIDFLTLMGEGQEAQFTNPPLTYPQISKQEILKKEYARLGVYLGDHPLDEFRPLFQKLSCCPLHELKLVGKGIWRTAFIIESVSIKISAKNQKKFAILSVHDGTEGYEIPVWSELYEQYLQLLTETRLIYAVVQVDFEGDEIKIQGKWFSDLTKVSDEIIATCDLAYDKAKSALKLLEMKMKMSKPKKEVEVSSEVILSLNLKLSKLSQILQIKKIFRDHAGSQPVKIDFLIEETVVGSLQIPKEWGISWNAEVEEKLLKISVTTKNGSLTA